MMKGCDGKFNMGRCVHGAVVHARFDPVSIQIGLHCRQSHAKCQPHQGAESNLRNGKLVWQQALHLLSAREAADHALLH